MTPNEKNDLPWIIAAGVMLAIAILALTVPEVVASIKGLLCWSRTGCEF